MSDASPKAADLPEGFRDLAPYLDWACDTETARHAKRIGSSMAEIRAFYEAMRGRIAEILEYLNGFPLDRLPPPEARLLALALALPEAANAVELFEEPGLRYGMPLTRFRPAHDRRGAVTHRTG